VDGAVVEPGDTWSLNAFVGQRTVEKGYVAAGAIVGGELVCCDHPDNIGGGTSQFATTLYNAIYFAGLEDVAHKPHSIYFSRYPLGHEATLGWTSPDLVFRNDTEYPVTIETSHTSTSITVQLVGANGRRNVESSVSGSATTSDGGTVTVTRIVRFQDGTSTTQTWFHRYNPIPPPDDDDDPEPPDPGPVPQ
jgi:vancomycin resistance protein YoaR